MFLYIYMYISQKGLTYVSVCVFISVHIDICEYICICMYVYINTYMRIYIIHIHM